MSDLPGTPQPVVDLAIIQDQIEKLTLQVALLMESQEVPANVPEPASQHPNCFIVMPFGVPDLEDLYTEFLLPCWPTASWIARAEMISSVRTW